MPRGGGFMGRGGFGGPMMGNHMGGMGGAAMRGGRNFTNDLYADYSGPDGSAVASGMGMGMGMGMAAPAMPAANVEPSVQVMVRNVRASHHAVDRNSHFTAAVVDYKRGPCGAIRDDRPSCSCRDSV